MFSRPALTRFARILLTMGSGETPWLIVSFVLGVTALGVFSNFVYSAAANPESLSWGGLGRVVLLVGGLILAAFLAYRYDALMAARKFRTVFDEKRLAPPHAELIWLLSPGSLDLPLMAIKHHCQKEAGEDRLRHCWLLMTPGAQETFSRLTARVAELEAELKLDVQLYPMALGETTIEASYRAVDAVYTVEAARVGLKPEAIIADLTGGLKTMTAGMVLTCLPHGRSLEYIESGRDAGAGLPVEGTQRAVLAGVDFKLAA
jgi:hypothetical protein